MAVLELSFSKEEFNHRKCRSTASSLSMPLLPISVHKGIAIASHFARGLCTPQPQCWWKEGFPCPNGCLRTAMGRGEGRPTRGHPAPGVIWLHAPPAVPCRWGAAQATTPAWRPLCPRGRTRGPRGMLSPGEPGATLQGCTAGAVPRASEVGNPWPRRITPAHDGTGGR